MDKDIINERKTDILKAVGEMLTPLFIGIHLILINIDKLIERDTLMNDIEDVKEDLLNAASKLQDINFD